MWAWKKKEAIVEIVGAHQYVHVVNMWKLRMDFVSACLRCENTGCIGIPSVLFNYSYCYPCGCLKFGRISIEKKTRYSI